MPRFLFEPNRWMFLTPETARQQAQANLAQRSASLPPGFARLLPSTEAVLPKRHRAVWLESLAEQWLWDLCVRKVVFHEHPGMNHPLWQCRPFGENTPTMQTLLGAVPNEDLKRPPRKLNLPNASLVWFPVVPLATGGQAAAGSGDATPESTQHSQLARLWLLRFSEMAAVEAEDKRLTDERAQLEGSAELELGAYERVFLPTCVGVQRISQQSWQLAAKVGLACLRTGLQQACQRLGESWILTGNLEGDYIATMDAEIVSRKAELLKSNPALGRRQWVWPNGARQVNLPMEPNHHFAYGWQQVVDLVSEGAHSNRQVGAIFERLRQGGYEVNHVGALTKPEAGLDLVAGFAALNFPRYREFLKCLRRAMMAEAHGQTPKVTYNIPDEIHAVHELSQMARLMEQIGVLEQVRELTHPARLEATFPTNPGADGQAPSINLQALAFHNGGWLERSLRVLLEALLDIPDEDWGLLQNVSGMVNRDGKRDSFEFDALLMIRGHLYLIEAKSEELENRYRERYLRHCNNLGIKRKQGGLVLVRPKAEGVVVGSKAEPGAVEASEQASIYECRPEKFPRWIASLNGLYKKTENPTAPESA